MTVPEKDVKLMDRDTLMGSLQVVYPVYLGGKRSALRAQARVGVEAARVSARKTDLQVIYDVKRMYYGSLLTRQLRELGHDTLERFKITLELTEHLYQSGVGRVKKTDYLRTQVMVATIRSMQELLKSNEELAQSALLNFMGLEWESRLHLEAQEIPFTPYPGDLAALVADAYEFNPDWRSLHLGLAAAEARIKEAQSGHLPMVALTGSLNHIDNAYDKGVMTPANKDSWTLGIGLEIPLFDGFRTTHAVKEARARLRNPRTAAVSAAGGDRPDGQGRLPAGAARPGAGKRPPGIPGTPPGKTGNSTCAPIRANWWRPGTSSRPSCWSPSCAPSTTRPCTIT